MVRTETGRRQRDLVHRVLPHIVAGLADAEGALALPDLARLAGADPYHFHRVFRRVTGRPVRRFVHELRMEYAAYRLLYTDHRVIDIAVGAGYDSHAGFTRAFRRRYGLPPARYRDRARPGPAPAEGPPPVVRRVPARLTVFVRHFGPYARVPEAWRRLREWLARQGVPPGEVTGVGVVYDEPAHVLNGDVRYDACAVVPSAIAARPGVGVQLLPEMDAAVLPHRGPAALLVCRYLRLLTWWATAGGGPTGGRPPVPLPYYEVYPRLPAGDDGSGEVTAEVLVALAPAGGDAGKEAADG